MGAFNNDGNTVVTGDVGTNVGAFNAFPPGVVIGSIHVANPISAQAATDVDVLYSYLDGLICGMVLGVNLGNNQILTPNIYCIGAASVLNGNLVLDGEGDPNARFIFQIDGALSTATLASVTYINSASACNVYWQINGAFDLGEGSSFVGTIVANGAITLLEASSLQGRALTRAGAVDLHNNSITLPDPPVSPLITADGDLTFCEGDSVILSGNLDGIWNTGDMSFSITVFGSGDYFVDNSNDCGIALSNIISVSVVPDNTPPMITCPSDLSIQCNESSLPANTGFATAMDDCDPAPAITFSDLIIPGICSYNEEILRTWVALDISGNDTFCIQSITISDLTGPVISCPGDMTLECTDPTDPGTAGMATATDNCSPSPVLSYSDVTAPGLCVDAFQIIRTWTATDDCANSSMCDQLIDVMDNILPTISCPSAIAISCTDSMDPATTGDPTATDNCDGNPEISFTDIVTPSGQCPQNYTINRTWTAMDNCSNSSQCIQQITVSDLTQPIITCPADVNVDCAASILPAATGFATATDDCDVNPGVDYSDANVPGNCPGLMDINRTWTTTDACGNLDMCVQIISISDLIDPVITCPIDVTLACTDPIDPGATGMATATDNCSLSPVISFADMVTPSGLCPQNYTINRTWTAVDDCSNSSQCIQQISVIDLTQPIITCPADLTVDCAASILPAATGFATATDDCDVNPGVDYSDANVPGSCPGLMDINRTWTATDACGNLDMCLQIITISDLIAPAITCPIDVTLACTDPTDPGATGMATATDNCSLNPVISFADMVTPSGLCSQNYTINRTWTAMDNCSNSGQCIQQITVSDLTQPIITCPADVNVDCAASILPAATGFATATDDCDVNPG
ncbi:MAG: DUF3494 domain-containing protein, partial [Saprospiraceae bacterium]|nr:DUF3494 domain-containing protein [Saprospiraceae bacterium]